MYYFSEKVEMFVTRKQDHNRYDGLSILHEYFTGSNLCGLLLVWTFIWVLFLI